jgi:hypothetical protein
MSVRDNEERATVERLVRAALETLLKRDGFLIAKNVNERSITHWLAVYLQEHFPTWDVDCEYNRDGHAPKELHLPAPQIDAEDTDATTVYPDIIVHKRGTPNNLLVIETKKTTSRRSAQFDISKLKQYQEQLGYTYGLFIEFLVADTPDVSRFDWIA